MEIKIEQLKTISPEITQRINSLLIQLNSESKALSDEDLNKIITDQSNYIFVAKDNQNKIIGMITLIVVNTLSSKKALIEDLVVEESFRGQGIGPKLINKAIEQAKIEEIKKIDFTSNPKRIVANKLYEGMGFKKRETNIYRIDL